MTIREKLADKTAKIHEITAALQSSSVEGELNFESQAQEQLDNEAIDSERDDILSDDDFYDGRDEYGDQMPTEVYLKETDP